MRTIGDATASFSAKLVPWLIVALGFVVLLPTAQAQQGSSTADQTLESRLAEIDASSTVGQHPKALQLIRAAQAYHGVSGELYWRGARERYLLAHGSTAENSEEQLKQFMTAHEFAIKAGALTRHDPNVLKWIALTAHAINLPKLQGPQSASAITASRSLLEATIVEVPNDADLLLELAKLELKAASPPLSVQIARFFAAEDRMERQENLARGRAAISDALRADNQNPNIHLLAAQILIELGEYEQARFRLLEAIQLPTISPMQRQATLEAREILRSGRLEETELEAYIKRNEAVLVIVAWVGTVVLLVLFVFTARSIVRRRRLAAENEESGSLDTPIGSLRSLNDSVATTGTGFQPRRKTSLPPVERKQNITNDDPLGNPSGNKGVESAASIYQQVAQSRQSLRGGGSAGAARQSFSGFSHPTAPSAPDADSVTATSSTSRACCSACRTASTSGKFV